MERTFDLSPFKPDFCLQTGQRLEGQSLNKNELRDRLSAKVLTAFYLACDCNELAIAERLLAIIGIALAIDTNTFPDEQERAQYLLVSAHGRLWQLKHP